MIYQPRVNRIVRSRTRVNSIGISILTLLLILLGATRLGNGVSSAFAYILTPALHARVLLAKAVEDFPVKSRGELTKENRELTASLLEAQAKLLDFSVIQTQNENLKSMLGRASNKNLELTAVLSKPNFSPYDTVLIDRGQNGGLTPGMLVLAYGNVPVGKVAEVYKNASLVRLFSSPGEENPVMIGAANIESTAKGMGGGNFLALLPKNATVTEGDTVRLPGLDPNVIGRVEKIESNDTETFSRVLFKSSVDLYQLQELFVVTSAN